MRKNLRNFGIFLLCTFIVFSNAFYTKAYGASSKVMVAVGNNYAKQQQEIIIPISFSNIPYNGISSLNFVIEFDDSLVLKDVVPGEIIDNSKDFSYSVKDNKIYLLFSDSKAGSNPIKKEGNFCYLNLKVPDSYKASFSIVRVANDKEIFCDNSMNIIGTDFKAGKITLKNDMYKVSSYKIWKINFTKELDLDKIKNGGVQVKDADGNLVGCYFNTTNDGKTLEIISPNGGYNKNKTYSIEISDSLLSKSGKKIKKPYSYYFYIEN